ncbi:MAG: hypothetical protein JWQ23_1813 [Herminiimonas sp.]|jgi:hypothetical protein|nr:hypothetical protein [Herminiimonas sp.]
MNKDRAEKNEIWTPPPPEKLEFPSPIPSRPDLETEQIVEQAIVMQQVAGTKQAASFLQEHNVPFDVVTRVLLKPSQRRVPKAKKKK